MGGRGWWARKARQGRRRVAAHSLSSLPGQAESPVATWGCELSPVVASPVVASARASLKPRASKATSGVKVGAGAALRRGEMVECWSTTAAMSAAIFEGEPQGEPARMTAISCDMSKSEDDSPPTESRRTSVALPGRPRRMARVALPGWPTMVVSLVAPCSERANGLLPAGLRQSKHLHFSWQRTPAWKHSQ